MKKTKIFQETFSDILKPQGFVFKNKTFIRVVGENIVQSLFLEATSPSYAFEMNLAPAATLTIPRGRIFFELMKREFRGKYNLSFSFSTIFQVASMAVRIIFSTCVLVWRFRQAAATSMYSSFVIC